MLLMTVFVNEEWQWDGNGVYANSVWGWCCWRCRWRWLMQIFAQIMHLRLSPFISLKSQWSHTYTDSFYIRFINVNMYGESYREREKCTHVCICDVDGNRRHWLTPMLLCKCHLLLYTCIHTTHTNVNSSKCGCEWTYDNFRRFVFFISSFCWF